MRIVPTGATPPRKSRLQVTAWPFAVQPEPRSTLDETYWRPLESAKPTFRFCASALFVSVTVTLTRTESPTLGLAVPGLAATTRCGPPAVDPPPPPPPP